MEARILRAMAVLAVAASLGASYRTANFIVEAPSPDLAEKIGKSAEQYRKQLATDWLGAPLPNWSRPCPIRADVSPSIGAGGATSFVFDRGEVFGWDMRIQGSEERVLDSVLPHEVTHTVFASHFRRPLPRWADEGACTTVEHASERTKQQQMLISFLRTGRGIAFHQMFAMKDYPADVLPLYSQGYSLARYLIEQGGRRKFLAFVGDGMKNENWSGMLDKHYGIDNLAALQDRWLDWVKQGSPTLLAGAPTSDALASADSPRETDPLFRAQSEDRSDRNDIRPAAFSRSQDRERDEAEQAPPAADHGWYASRRDAATREGTHPRADDNRRAASPPPFGQPSASDRSSAPAPAKPPMVNIRDREPIQLAQRDTPASDVPRRVLLEWRKPE